MADSMSYVAICHCGAIRAAAVDDPSDSKEIRKSVGNLVRDCIQRGYKIERWTTEQVRSAQWKCLCVVEDKKSDKLVVTVLPNQEAMNLE